MEKNTFKDLPNGCTGRMTFLENGKLLAVSYNHGLQLWNVADRKLARSITGTGLSSIHSSFSGDGNTAAFGVGNEVKLLDLTKKTTVEVPLVPRRRAEVRAAALSPDGRFLAAADAAKAIVLHDLTTGKDRVMGNDYAIAKPYRLGLGFGSDETTLFVRSLQGATRLVRSHDTFLGQVVSNYTPSAACYSLALSPDGKTLACGLAGGKIELFDLATAKVVRELAVTANTAIVSSLAYSPDGLTLGASYASGSSPLFFETTTGREVRDARFPGLGKTNYANLAFSADGLPRHERSERSGQAPLRKHRPGAALPAGPWRATGVPARWPGPGDCRSRESGPAGYRLRNRARDAGTGTAGRKLDSVLRTGWPPFGDPER